mmetsp:Transcript_74941/g.243518  ORF Transcript_74941/g.243518 Transcript_74941/m.243518 type:complete len:274 (+) Transcript_74941:38-859(+)
MTLPRKHHRQTSSASGETLAFLCPTSAKACLKLLRLTPIFCEEGPLHTVTPSFVQANCFCRTRRLDAADFGKALDNVFALPFRRCNGDPQGADDEGVDACRPTTSELSPPLSNHCADLSAGASAERAAVAAPPTGVCSALGNSLLPSLLPRLRCARSLMASRPRSAAWYRAFAADAVRLSVSNSASDSATCTKCSSSASKYGSTAATNASPSSRTLRATSRCAARQAPRRWACRAVRASTQSPASPADTASANSRLMVSTAAWAALQRRFRWK